ncbi:MAG: DNA-binding protein WhiA [Clostridiales bacterium]|nr:DNA-binding protein WhiA [Clostridiales bacterium]MBR5975406.1 DNA-binding protein WhiA [Clostridiales bacterium]
MSEGAYSQKVKEEICKVSYKTEEEWAAEMAAIILCSGYSFYAEEARVRVRCSNEMAAQRLVSDARLCGRDFALSGPEKVGRRGGSVYEVLLEQETFLAFIDEYLLPDVISERIASDENRRRAMLRGAFLARGSMSDPNRTYRVEMICKTDAFVKMLILLLHAENIRPMTRVNDTSWSIFFKKHEEICDFLVILGAPYLMLELQNIRAQHDVNRMVTRSVNLDNWTMTLQADASAKRTKQLEELLSSEKASRIPRELLEVARIHIENPGASLTELGKLMDPPISKSGMYHRLQKLLDYL